MLNYRLTQPLDVSHSPTYGFFVLPKNCYKAFFLLSSQMGRDYD